MLLRPCYDAGAARAAGDGCVLKLVVTTALGLALIIGSGVWLSAKLNRPYVEWCKAHGYEVDYPFREWPQCYDPKSGQTYKPLID
jgi:hypothetical protein